jgi:hypothetical protein
MSTATATRARDLRPGDVLEAATVTAVTVGHDGRIVVSASADIGQGWIRRTVTVYAPADIVTLSATGYGGMVR